MAEPVWSSYTDVVISDIDSTLGNKYGKLNLRKLLADPSRYAAQANIVSDAQKMKKDIDGYFDGVLGGLSDQSKALDASLSKADSVTSQLMGNISMQAKQNKLPLIKPVVIDRDITRDETIYIDGADGGVLALISKLVENSTYVADSTGSYRNMKLGEWVFGGSNKTYVLRVYVPQNEVMLIEGARNEIDRLFGVAVDYLENAKK